MNKTMMKKNTIKHNDNIPNSTSKLLIHLVFILFSLLCVVPFIIIISISFSSDSYIRLHGYSMIPKVLNLNGYRMIFADTGQIFNSYGVSIFITIFGTAISMWCVATIGFVISRRDYKFARTTTIFVFLTMLFNGGLIPTYILMTRILHLQNSLFAVILPLLVNGWSVLLMKGFMRSVPVAMIESAKIDGASELRIFLYIIIPMAKAGIATLSLFSVLLYWNEWFLPLLYIENMKIAPLQLLLYRVMSNAQYLASSFASFNQNLLVKDIPTLSSRMAIVVVAAAPMLPVFLYFQKYFVKGLVIGSLKE